VTPLTEACGLIEWVNHTSGLRNCCQSAYRAAGKFDKSTNQIIKSKYDNFKVRQNEIPARGSMLTTSSF
jgi:hypothetical protein